jgi:hypothetical protein
LAEKVWFYKPSISHKNKVKPSLHMSGVKLGLEFRSKQLFLFVFLLSFDEAKPEQRNE